MVDGQAPESFVQGLVSDHRRLRTLLERIERLAAMPGKDGAAMDVPALRAGIARLTWLDAGHQARETRWLFPLLGRRCPPLGSVLARMELEHDSLEGMRCDLAGLLASLPHGDRAAATELAHRLTQFVRLSRGHMGVEEDYIFPVAAEFLTAADWASIDAGLQAS